MTVVVLLRNCLLSSYQYACLLVIKVKGKGKGRLWLLQHCCLEAYFTLTRMSSFIHLQRRCTNQAAWEISASEGRNYTWNYLAIRNLRKSLGSFTCRKSGTWDRFFYFPPEEGMLRIFTPVKIQRIRPGLIPQTWVPEASMLTTRPPKPSFS